MNLKNEWRQVLLNVNANYGVTLAYNPHIRGTYEPMYRKKSNGDYQQLTRREGVGNRLTTNRSIRKTQIDSDIALLAKKLDRELLGTRFNLAAKCRWSSYAGFIEHPESNLHIHLMWRCHDPNFKAPYFINKIWKEFDRNHTADVTPITNADVWAAYILKKQSLEDLNNPDRSVFCRQFVF